MLALVLLLMTEDARPPVTMRTHYVVNDARGVAFTITDINEITDTTNHSYALIRDERDAQQWIVENAVDFEKKTSIHELRDLRGEIFLRVSYPMNTPGRTRADAHELIENAALGRSMDELITMETPGVERIAKQSQWDDYGNLDRWRSEFRRNMNPVLLEAIERMRPLFDSDLLLIEGMLWSRLLHGERDPEDGVHVTPAKPDCVFDRSFGFDCTEQNKKNAEKATEQRLHY